MRGHRHHSPGWIAAVLMVATMLVAPWTALAQDATPTVMSEPVKSPTRDEFQAQIVEEMGYTEPATPGGTFIDSNTADIQTLHPFPSSPRKPPQSASSA